MTDQYMALLAKNYPESTTKVVKLELKLIQDCYQHFRALQFLLETIHEPSTRELIDRYYERISEDFFSRDGM